MDWQRVAKRVRAERRAAGYRTQKAAADAAGVSLATWGLIENGRQEGYKDFTVEAVCRLFGWQADGLDRLARGEEPVVVPPRQATLEELRAPGFTAYERPAAPSVALEQLEQVGDLGRRVSSLEKQMSEVLELVRRLPGTEPGDDGGER